MELIPVLDLAHGVAVHAAGGDRSRYAPVRSVLTPGAEGDALALARAYRRLPGVTRCYVADLDAIAGGPVQRELLWRLQSEEGFGGPLLLDAGVASPAALVRVKGAFTQVVVGLETLRSFADLAELASLSELTFSLDLRNDVPMTRPELIAEAGRAGPPGLARAAIEAGARSVLVLDVGRVGQGAGPNLALLAGLRAGLPGVPLLAGGGVHGPEHLTALADCGCDGVLVATALHNGAITAWDDNADQSGASDVR